MTGTSRELGVVSLETLRTVVSGWRIAVDDGGGGSDWGRGFDAGVLSSAALLEKLVDDIEAGRA